MYRLYEERTFPFEWLDEIIEVTLNPKFTECELIRDDQLQSLRVAIAKEMAELYLRIKITTFELDSRDKIRTVVEQFELEVLYLRELAEENIRGYAAESELYGLGKFIIVELEVLMLKMSKRYPSFTKQIQDENPARRRKISTVLYKVLCRLSVDQLGIILKAADETKLILSRSLSMVFKAIVPYLATENKDELSWDSMRSSTYHPEESDKAAAIEALEKLIRKIKDF